MEPTFASLTADFVQYYEELDRHYKEGQYAGHENTADCYVTFGITGAGKSTTIARLLSQMSPAEFREKILDRSVKSLMINGVEIGHESVSTTVIPKIYSVGDFHVCDMPGFSDIEPRKRILIDMLTKCFVTRIRRPKYLVVMDINKIIGSNGTSVKGTTFLDHYHQPLIKMLGTRYPDFIEQVHFVLTKNKAGYGNAELSNALLELKFDLIDDKHALAFLNRLEKVHMVADLEDSCAVTHSKIQDMIITAQTQAMQLGQVEPFRMDFLAAGENELHVVCGAAFAHMDAEFEKLQVVVSEYDQQISLCDTQAREEAKRLCDEQSALITEGRKIASEISAIESRRRASCDLDSGREMRLETAKITFSDRKRHLELLNQLNFSPRINVRCDYSIKKDKLFSFNPNKNKYTLKSAIGLSNGIKHAVVIVATDNDPFEAEFCSGKIPSTLEALRHFNDLRVLANSIKATTVALEEYSVKPFPGMLLVECTHSVPFKVYTFLEHPPAHVHEYAMLKKVFTDLEVGAKNAFVQLQGSLTTRDQASKVDDARLDELRGLKRDVSAELGRMKDKIDPCAAKIRAGFREFREKLRDLNARATALKNNPVLERIGKIKTIFETNHITSTLDSSLKEYENRHSSFMQRTCNLAGTIDSLCSERVGDLNFDCSGEF